MTLPATVSQQQEIIWEPLEGSQKLAISCPCNHILYEGSRGPGKRLTNDTKIFTDSGWKLVGDVNYSDRLLAPDGSFTKITGIYPHDEQPIFEVTFDEGQKIKCGPEHLWSISDGKNKGWKVRDTEWLYSRVKRRNETNQGTRYQTPRMTAPAPGRQWNGLDPYMAGLLLGDGTLKSKNVILYSIDEETIEYAKSLGWSVGKYDRPCHMMWCNSDESEQWKDLLGRHKREHKRVPQELLEADPDARLSLLQGLLDSDGTADDCGKIQFINTSEHLCKAVQYLVRSFGGKATYSWHNRYDGFESKNGLGGKFRVYINLPNGIIPFRLTRKRERVKTKRKFLNRGIVDIQPAGRDKATCFAVEHHSHQFVIEDFVVTHNTDAQLMFFRRFVGIGFGRFWRGVIFDKEYKNLDDIISKSKRWFPMFGDGAKFISSASQLKWVWPTGEELMLRTMKNIDDYEKFHGQEFPFIAWNELTKRPTSDCYDAMMSCNRSSFVPKLHSPIDNDTGEIDLLPEIPLVVFSTTNPYGPGHNWVKQRFIDAAPPGQVVKITKDVFNPRTGIREPITKTQVRLFGSYKENKYLSPEYVLELESIKDPNKRKAWLEGDWDITSGGMFDDVWSTEHNIVEPFNIPNEWRIFRSFDWGSSAPFSVGWWAESDGCDIQLPGGQWKSTVKGDLFRIAEWYGWSGTPNQGIRLLATQIAKGIVEREIKMGYYGRVKPGPADNSINDTENGNCIAADMAKKVRINGKQYKGVTWAKSDKSPGSRKNGWEKLRVAIFNAQPDVGPREYPGIFVFRTCQDGFIRTLPTIPRCSKDPDDVDTDAEDHVCDEVRYVILSTGDRFSGGSTTGHY